jgi:hypothetical protein
VVEVAPIGTDGFSGSHVLFGQTSIPYRCFVQIAGAGFRIPVDKLLSAARKSPSMHRDFLHYTGSLMVQIMQNVACNGLHKVEARCCRWLLITSDRLKNRVVPLTHEFLGQMLGVRRASVSEVLKPLKNDGLLDYTRGEIILLNRRDLESRSCECYRIINKEFEWLG